MWRFVVTDPQFRPVGELLNAADRRVGLPLSAVPTATFKVRLDNPMVPYLVSQDYHIKVYDERKALRYFGPIVDSQEEADDQGNATLVVSSASPAWALAKRLIGKTKAGFTSSSADIGLLAGSLIELMNEEVDTHIRVGAIFPTVSSPAGTWRFKPCLEAISELAATLGGFEYFYVPIEPTTTGRNVAIAEFQAAPIIGQDRPNTIFEYGTGRHNVASYSAHRNGQGRLTRGWSLPSGYPDTAGEALAFESATDLSAGRLYEEVVSEDLVADNLRLAIVTEHVEVRKSQRKIVTFTLKAYEPGAAGLGRPPQFGVDYDVGDIVNGRAVSYGLVRYDGLFRVWGVTMNVENDDRLRPELSLVPEGASA